MMLTRRQSSAIGYSLLVVLTIAYMAYSNDRLGVMSVSIFYMKSQLHITNVQFALLTSAFFLGYLPFPLLSGWISDRLRTPILIPFSIAVFSIATLLVAYASSYDELLILRVLTGAGEGVFVPVAAGLLAKFFSNRRGLAMGFFNMGFTLGVTSGDFMGGYLGSIYKTYTYNFIYSASWGFLIAVASFLFLYSFRREISGLYGKDVNKSNYSSSVTEEANKGAKLKVITNFLTLGLIFSVVMLFMNSWASTDYITWLAYYLHTVRHVTPAISSYYTGYVFVGAAAGSLILGMLSDKIMKLVGSKSIAIVIPSVGAGVFVLLLVLINNDILAIVMAFAAGFLYAGIFPVALALGQDSVDSKYASAASGLGINILSVAPLFAPASLALMIHSSFVEAMVYNIALPWIATGILGIVLWISFRHRHKLTEATH
ncbi:MAG: MFS transporter [Nitrososphaerota archaeon]|nr:MFS transporter [Nitrososphaerota archaeon]